MNHQASIQTIPTRTSQWMRGNDLLPVLIPVRRRPVILPSHQPSFFRPFAWSPREDDSCGLAVRFTHCLFSSPDLMVSNHKIWSGAIASASLSSTLQADVSIERQFSHIFPAHPRSLARCLSRALRHSSFCFGCAALRVWVSKEKISLRLRPLAGRDFYLRSLRRKTRLRPWERGTLASLRARVSRR